MIVTLAPDADPQGVRRALTEMGLWACRYDREEGPVCFTVQPWSEAVQPERILSLEGVESVARAASPHPLIDRQRLPLSVAGVRFGGPRQVLMAGPCSVESPEQIRRIASRLAPLGVRLLRGGAFKPRTSPYAFQGVGEQALGWLRAAADEFGMGVITEALGESTVDAVAAHAEMIQIGSRNMHSYSLLREVARAGKPVLLKRGMAATVEEWLLAGEYLLYHGAAGVVFCERGIRGFDPSTRNLLDLASVALLAHVHRLPVVVDPSHALGRRDLILPLSRAARAAGAVGLLIETHDDPGRSLSDGPQALLPAEFEELAKEMLRGESIGGTPPGREAGPTARPR